MPPHEVRQSQPGEMEGSGLQNQDQRALDLVDPSLPEMERRQTLECSLYSLYL
jgi:hypothetical protein